MVKINRLTSYSIYDEHTKSTIEQKSLRSFIYVKHNTPICHREDGPTCLSFYDNGFVDTALWYFNGERHRLDGPAEVNYDTSGNIINSEYYIYNEKYADEITYHYFLEFVKTIKSGLMDRNTIIMNIKHESKYVREACKEALNGGD